MKIETDEQLQECIKAIEEALIDGHIEEHGEDDECAWSQPVTMVINSHYAYRIKPKPLECWVNVYSDREVTMAHESAAAAMERAQTHSPDLERVAVHMREVVDE